MRARLAKAHPGEVSLEDLKRGAGAMQDIELLASTGALLGASPTRSPRRQLEAGAQVLGLSETAIARLIELYARLSRLRQAIVLSGGVPSSGTGAERFVLTAGDAATLDALSKDLTRDTKWANEAIAAVLKPA